MRLHDPIDEGADPVKTSRRLPLIVACALFIENMDSTVLSTALPAIAHDYGVDPISLKLVLTSYLLSLAVFIPISATGPRRRYQG